MAGSTYTWKIDGVEQTSTADNIDITWSNTGTFTITVQEHQNSCDGDVQSGQVIVNPKITPTFAAVGPYCPGATIPALPTTSVNGITGTWSPAINNTATTIYTFTPAADQCAVPTTLTITVEDIIKPTFTLPTLAAGYCVEKIYEAVYNDGFEETPTDLTYLRPDYYLFEQGSTLLNLPSYSDNCNLAANPISWTIDFADGTSLSGTGQLENYVPLPPTVPPDRPVPGIHFPVGTNKITFRVTDAMGNFLELPPVILEVIPRPTITTNF
jgi:hypothetical protein